MEVHNNYSEPWKVTLVDTGLNTMTGGRVRRIRPFVGDEPFMLTYGDGVANVNLEELEKFHRAHGKIATITAVNVGQRFGIMDIRKDGAIQAFREKNDHDGALINGGFMLMNSGIFDYLEDDSTVLEKAPLENLAKDGQLMAYPHSGFGNAWTPSGTGSSWKSCGRKGKRLGRFGINQEENLGQEKGKFGIKEKESRNLRKRKT